MYSSLKVEREKERRGSDDDDDDDDKFTELQRNEDEKIRIDGLKMAPKKEVKLEKSGLFKKPAEPTKRSGGKSESSGEKRKMSALEEIMKEEEERKKKQASFLLKKLIWRHTFSQTTTFPTRQLSTPIKSPFFSQVFKLNKLTFYTEVLSITLFAMAYYLITA